LTDGFVLLQSGYDFYLVWSEEKPEAHQPTQPGMVIFRFGSFSKYESTPTTPSGSGFFIKTGN
jgi:hypothetical protein